MSVFLPVELGDKVKDRITGVTGIVICEASWLNGCRRTTIQPQELKDGKPVDSYTIDTDDAIIIEKHAVERKDKETAGPMPAPVRR